MAMEHPLELTCVSEAAYKSMIKDIDDNGFWELNATTGIVKPVNRV